VVNLRKSRKNAEDKQYQQMPYFYCFKQLHETNILKKPFSFPPVVRNATSFFSIEKRLFFLNNVELVFEKIEILND
jgi:hypothetical protein